MSVYLYVHVYLYVCVCVSQGLQSSDVQEDVVLTCDRKSEFLSLLSLYWSKCNEGSSSSGSGGGSDNDSGSIGHKSSSGSGNINYREHTVLAANY